MSATLNLSPAALRAIEDAALVETFDPVALARDGEALDPQILEQLASVSEEVVMTDSLAWALRSDARQTFLSALLGSDRLEAALGRQADRDAPFSRYLATALRGVRLDAEPGSTAEREKAIVAYEVATASLAGAPSRDDAQRVAQEDLARLRSLSSLDAERSRSDAILAGPLIGREKERAALLHYVRSGMPDPASALPEPKSPRLTQRPFLITGCAGAGKSALLADIIRARRHAEGPWQPVVLLDFDRPANCRGGPAEWYSELTRQLGLGRPALAERLRQVRRRAGQSVSTETATDSPISGHLVADRIRGGLLPALIEEQMADRSLLVVLDTFEEVLTRSDLTRPEESLFADILHWAAELARISDYSGSALTTAFSQVRIVVSGRSRPDLAGDLSEWFCGEMEIGALDHPAAVTFLGQRDRDKRLTPGRLRRAVEVVGGHPLSLILFERFVHQQPRDVVDEMLDHGDLSGLMSGEEAARSLYSRFLLRLNVESRGGAAVDPEKVRRIAHPGLVLREVTAAHIEEIIAPGCGVALEPGEAQILFDRLTDQVWLVEVIKGRPVRTVRHRADVRRLMLPMMSGMAVGDSPAGAGPVLGQHVRAVRRLAVKWFEERSSHILDEAQVEAAYHRAFLDDVDAFIQDAPLWNRVWSLAPDDVLAMPPRAAALIRYHARGAASLSREQTADLPEPLRTSAAVEQTHASLAAGRAAEAAATAETLQSDPVPPRSTDELPPGGDAPRPPSGSSPLSLYALAREPALAAEVNAAFLSGQYEKAAAIGWRAIMDMSEAPLFEPLPIDEDITSHWLWHAALARMVSPDDKPGRHWLDDTFRKLLSYDRMKDFGTDSAGLVLAAAIYIASAGRCPIPKSNATPLLAAIARRTKAVKGPGAARLLTLTALWSLQEVLAYADISPALLPADAASTASLPLVFSPLPAHRQPNPRAVGDRPALRPDDPYHLLNARLPELEPLVLAVIGAAIQDDSERLLKAVERLEPAVPGRPKELEPEYVRHRVGDMRGNVTALASVIAAANAHGVLPDLLAELQRGGPPRDDLTKLHEIANTYRWLLGADFVAR
jgi:hypothetical protein